MALIVLRVVGHVETLRELELVSHIILSLAKDLGVHGQVKSLVTSIAYSFE